MRVVKGFAHEGVDWIGLYPLVGRETDAHHAPSQEQVELCREWIRQFATRTERINSGYALSSYTLKHLVESWRRHNGGNDYISNGAFIEAMMREGFRARRCDVGSPNAVFNASISKSVWQDGKRGLIPG